MGAIVAQGHLATILTMLTTLAMLCSCRLGGAGRSVRVSVDGAMGWRHQGSANDLTDMRTAPGGEGSPAGRPLPPSTAPGGSGIQRP
jgi:hypothetical protein